MDDRTSTALPPLLGDRSFIGLTATQFLGAFNDNLFKQVVLLMCVDSVRRGGSDLQPAAMAVFALPFVLFSGLAGYLADRHSKQRIVVWSKVAEIAVMALGVIAFLGGSHQPAQALPFLLAVLCLMAAQSAFFGPAKYGILPQMLRTSDLPMANGIIQMTTFVAIIFGWALAGHAKMWFEDRLWLVGALCVGVAAVGTVTSLAVRTTAVACPGLPFRWSALAINRQVIDLLRRDHSLLFALICCSFFWFLGGVVQPTVNAFGKLQLGLDDRRTSAMGACLAVGIALGCVVAGRASRQRVNFALTRVGAWGMAVCLALLATTAVTVNDRHVIERVSWLILMALGGFGGCFVVPLTVFIQARPPEEMKGQIIGTMNLFDWVAIIMAAGCYLLGDMLLSRLSFQHSTMFAGLALFALSIALFFKPSDQTSDATRLEHLHHDLPHHVET